MRTVFAPIDVYNKSHLAGPGTPATQVLLAWGVELETDEEREMFADIHMPYHQNHARYVNLGELQAKFESKKRKLRYENLTTQQFRDGLVGLQVSYLWQDADMLGFDFHRGEAHQTGGVSLRHPHTRNLNYCPISRGLITASTPTGVILENLHEVTIPDGTTIHNLTETEFSHLLNLAD